MAKNRDGFTLVEILIVLIVIGLFAGISLAYINTFSAKKGLETEMNKLTAILETAQKKAISGESCASYTGYQVSMTSSSYTLYKCCGACTGAGNQIMTYSFPTGYSVTNTGGTLNIQFKVLAAGTNLSSTRSISVKNSSVTPTSTQCMIITVAPNGLISSSNTLTACL